MKYVIDFDNALTTRKVNAFLKGHGLKKVRDFDNFSNTIVAEGEDFDTTATYAEIESIAVDDTPVQLLEVTQTNTVESFSVDPSDADMWWYQAISTGKLIEDTKPWEFVKRGQNATVYMVDSGCDLDHAEFEGATVTNLWTFQDGDFTDQNGHGTALTSVIAGKTVGVTRSHVKQVKLFDKRFPTYISDITAAFDAIIADHATSPGNKVVNLSWSIPRNAVVENKIGQMRTAGLLVVCAAGNSGMPIGDVTPAAMEEIVTVGAFSPEFKPSSFSDYTSSISTSPNDVNSGALDLWAPGEKIIAANVAGGLSYVAGTSVASAIAAACAASYLGAKPLDFVLDGDTLNRMSFFTFSIADALDLSEEKYAASANRVTAFASAMGVYVPGRRSLGFAHPGETVEKLVYHPETAEKATLDGPEWLSLTSEGLLTGTAPAVEEPEVYHVAISLQNGDDVVETLLIGFLIPNGQEKNVETVEEKMEPADYQLLGVCYCPPDGTECCETDCGIGKKPCTTGCVPQYSCF